MDKVSNFKMGRGDGKAEGGREMERNKEMRKGEGREGKEEKKEGRMLFSQRPGKVVVRFPLLHSKAAILPLPLPAQGKDYRLQKPYLGFELRTSCLLSWHSSALSQAPPKLFLRGVL